MSNTNKTPPDDRSGETGTLLNAYRDAVLLWAAKGNVTSGPMLAARRALDERIAGLVRERDEAQRALREAADFLHGIGDIAVAEGEAKARLYRAESKKLRAALTPPEARADDQ